MHQQTTDYVLLTLVAITLALLSPSASHGEPFAQCGIDDIRYERVEVGSLNGDRGGYATAINNRGEVTGALPFTFEVGRGFIWDCLNGPREIGALEPGSTSLGVDINNRGEIVGYSTADFFNLQAFIWDRRNGIRAIAPIPSRAYAINDAGDVLFHRSGVYARLDTTLWNQRGGSTPVSELLGFESASEIQLNNRRKLTGLRDRSDSLEFFEWSARNGVRTLGSLPRNSTEAFAYGANDRGDLVGMAPATQ